MAAPNRNAPRIKDSEQNVLNDSFDETYGVLAVESLVYNPVSGTLDRKQENGSSLATGQVTVSTSATQIVAQRSARKSVVVINNGTTDVFIGASGVTTGDGLLLLGVKGGSIAIDTTAAIYGVVASGTCQVTYMEVY